MKRAVLLATRNAGKVREMRPMLARLGVTVQNVADLEAQLGDAAPDVIEDGETFADNCLLKARAYAVWSGLPVIAEDSGICVDALDGAPGVHSARFAGHDADDAANNRKLLQLLEHVPEGQRGAHYHTTAIYLESTDAEPLEVEGRWFGKIVRTPQGEGGFGYDPLFWVPSHGCTSAQLPAEVKNELSHRGQAIRALMDRLQSHWGAEA